MNPITLGPIALPIPVLIILSTLFTALFCAWRWRRRGAADMDNDVFLVALGAFLGARLGFLVVYAHHTDSVWQLLDIRDGGWWWPGFIIGGSLTWLWRAWRHRRAPLPWLSTTAISSAVLFSALALSHISAPEQHQMPDIALQNLNGETQRLSELNKGFTVINLWATWCPPCQREMPVIARAEQRHPEIAFVMANQGEQAAEVMRYLDDGDLSFSTVLLDPSYQLSETMGSYGLPMTVIYDPDGNEVARHFGPLSDASLAQLLRRHGAI